MPNSTSGASGGPGSSFRPGYNSYEQPAQSHRGYSGMMPSMINPAMNPTNLPADYYDNNPNLMNNDYYNYRNHPGQQNKNDQRKSRNLAPNPKMSRDGTIL